MTKFRVGQSVRVNPDIDDEYLRKNSGKIGKVVEVFQGETWCNHVEFQGSDERFCHSDAELISATRIVENK